MTPDADRVDVPGYEILGLVGRGGMGVVYRARQVALDRVVALKTIPPEFCHHDAVVTRFEREARAVGRLSHPHIVSAYDFGRHAGRLFLAMEFIAGRDAQSLIDSRAGLDEWTVWGLVRQAATALDHAARHGLVHRDVKPANLLLTSPPTGFPLPAGLPLVKVVDFGLARLVEVDAEESRLTQANRILGTPYFMAPEQVLGGDVGPQADIYALGATAYCMLSGLPPLAGRTVPQIIAAHVDGGRGRSGIPPLGTVCPTVSHASAALVAAMMAHEPDRRITGYGELLGRIDGLQLASPSPPAAANALATLGAPTASGMIVHHPRSGADRPVTGRVGPLVVGLLAAAAVAFVAAWAVVTARPARLERRHVPSGARADLFDGSSLTPWRTIHGRWAIGRDAEGATVLEGAGLASQPLFVRNDRGERTQPEHYRLTCLVDRGQANAAEIQFDLPPTDAADDPTRMVVRITAAAVACGRLATAAGPLGVVATRARDDGEAIHAVEIERQAASWWIAIDGERLVVVPCLRPRAAGEIVLGAAGGPARFSDITLEELVPQAHVAER